MPDEKLAEDPDARVRGVARSRLRDAFEHERDHRVLLDLDRFRWIEEPLFACRMRPPSIGERARERRAESLPPLRRNGVEEHEGLPMLSSDDLFEPCHDLARPG